MRDQIFVAAILSKRLHPSCRVSTKLSADILRPSDKNFRLDHRSPHRRFLQPHDRSRSAAPAFYATVLATVALISKRAKPPIFPGKLHRSSRSLLPNLAPKFSSRGADWARFLEAGNFRRHQISQSRSLPRRRTPADRAGRRRRDETRQRRDQSGGSRFAR